MGVSSNSQSVAKISQNAKKNNMASVKSNNVLTIKGLTIKSNDTQVNTGANHLEIKNNIQTAGLSARPKKNQNLNASLGPQRTYFAYNKPRLETKVFNE